MLIYAKTNTGLVRPTNEDSLLIGHQLYGVADGMGGHRGGETASRVAVQVIRTLLGGKIPEENTLRVGLEAANRRIFDMQRRDPALNGMGTTLTLIWESAAELLIAHVGDSRAYLYRDGCLECRTQDHSIVGELLRSVITRALGTDPIVQPDVFRVEKQDGDVWLLCSDGLYNMVEDAEISSTLESLRDEPAADRLLTLALEHGGSDNVSLVLGRVTEVNAP